MTRRSASHFERLRDSFWYRYPLAWRSRLHYAIGRLSEVEAERDGAHRCVQTLTRRSEYLADEINFMRRAMQHAGTWDQFCSDYAAYKAYREHGDERPRPTSSLFAALAERWLDPENDDPAEWTDDTLMARIEDLVGEGWYHAGKELERADALRCALAETSTHVHDCEELLSPATRRAISESVAALTDDRSQA